MESNLNQNEFMQDLAQFGLCPFDWSIEKKDKDVVVIKNTVEDDFQFIGKLDRSNKHWEYLQLHMI